MKHLLRFIALVIVSSFASVGLFAQDSQNIVHVQRMKLKWPENGTAQERDSLTAIYNNNVIKKNDKVLSHRELAHFFTASSTDYLVIEEYKDLKSMEDAFKINDELEKKAWPDEKKRKEFMDKVNSYFERWHSDEVYHINSALTK